MALKRSLAITLLFLPVIIYFFVMTSFWVDVPHYDEWELPPLIEKASGGELPVKEVFAPHNEHRSAIPYSALVALGVYSSMDARASMLLAFSVICMVAVIMLRVYTGTPNGKNLLSFLPALLMIFNIGQWETLFWGLSAVHWSMLLLAAVSSHFFMMRSGGRDRYFTLSMISAFLACFCSAAGFALWVSLPLHILLKHRMKGLASASRVLLAGAIFALLYFYGQGPVLRPAGIWENAAYLFAYLGSFTRDIKTAIPAGAVFLALSAAAVLMAAGSGARSRDEEGFFVSVLFFVIASGILLSLGRSGSGAEQALSSRYLLLSSTGIAMLYLSARASAHKAIWGGFGCIIMVVYIWTAYTGLQDAARIQKIKNNAALLLTSGKELSRQELASFWPYPDKVKEAVLIMKKNKLSVYRDK